MKQTFRRSFKANYLLLFILSAKTAMATTDTWSGTTSSSMSVGTNWQGGTVPSLSGNDDLVFPPGGVTNYTVLNDIAGVLSLTSISLNGTNSYTITASPGNSFSFASGGTITSTGTHSINVPTAFNGPISISSDTGTLSLLGPISNGTTVDITSGAVVFGSGNSYTGTTTIHYNTSNPVSLQVNNSAAIPNHVVVDGTLNFAVTGSSTFGYKISRTSGVIGGGLQITGTGTLTLTGDNSSYSGPIGITNGILSISSDSQLGDLSSTNIVSLGTGTLKVTGGATLSPQRKISLTGSGTIDTGNSAVSIQGVISEASPGIGALTVSAGSGSIALSGVNTYTGGTTLESGTLLIGAQNNLGNGTLRMGGSSTLSITAPINAFSLPIVLTGPSTIETNNQAVTIVKPISGSGLLTIRAGSSTLTLSSAGGANSYGGGTEIATGTVVGNTNSIVGSYQIDSGSTLIFDQAAIGTYGGVLTGNGSLKKQGLGSATLSGSSPAFTGATTVTGGSLRVTGSLPGSIVHVSSGANLGGSGTVGAVVVTDGVIGRNGLQTLTISGPLTFDSSSTYAVNIAPSGVCDLLQVSGTAMLSGAHLLIDPEPGFYGFGSSYTILRGGSIVGDFSAPTSTHDNFSFATTKSGDGNTLYLHLAVTQPFYRFPASNPNNQSVVDYINTLGVNGVLARNPALVKAINSLEGESFATINHALDQLQPAVFSVFGELQADLGGHLISLFHRRPGTISSERSLRFWAEPYGNWLKENSIGMQQGFHSRSLGVATGIDWELFQNFVVGFGGAYNHSDLLLQNQRGTANVDTYYGAAYLDYTYKFFYFGGALLMGIDRYDTHRRIVFTTIDETAKGNHKALDLIGQFSCGLFFGPPAFCLFPYLNVDYFFLDQDSFSETGAHGLNLRVDRFNTQTIRTELGFGMNVRDLNAAKTMSLSPKVALGWTMDIPICREKISSAFQGETMTFKVQGWDKLWQLFSFTLGLDFSYKSLTLGGEYVGQIGDNDALWSQQANVNLGWQW